jgi:hypothetical protein
MALRIGGKGHRLYQVGGSTTSWLMAKNPKYTQIEGRSELFASRAEGQNPGR